MDKKTRNERNVGDYSGKDEITHAYDIPDTFIGSCKPEEFETEVLNRETKKFEKCKLDIPNGVRRVFLEILSNAGDNTDASRRAKVDPGEIEITMDQKTINIRNGGLHIPVKKISLSKEKGNISVKNYKEGDGEWKWLPEFIFGQLRSSNNYDTSVKRMGCGRNGFGGKLTNIFSKRFVLEIKDPDTKIHFKGTWRNNMFKGDPSGKPEIEVKEDIEIDKGSVSVEWDLDFERFKMTKYSEKDLDLFARYAVDFSFTCKIKTFFNGIELDFRNIKDYASLIWKEEELKNSFINYVWGEDTPKKIKNTNIINQDEFIKQAKKIEHIPDVEILVVDTPDNSHTISYVNGLVTVEGGVHLEAAQDPLMKHISSIINDSKSKSKKGIITSRNIKPHLSFIVNARLVDPEYTSQTKTKLASPTFTVSYPEKFIKDIENWNIINRLNAEVDAMAAGRATKTDGNKRKHIPMDKGEDANLAGTKSSLQCKLFLVEGLSAANYPQKRICMLEGGKDLYGYMPLKGKFMNITKARAGQYADNSVVASIKQVLGLKEEVDYSDYENIKTLRYGFIILTVDADDDGMHILCHVLNFFREKFPGIIKRNMIGYLRTPVIKVLRGDKIQKRFFTVPSFETWKEKNSLKGLTVRYFKGLGTSNDDDIKDDMTTAPTIICFYDSKCVENFDLAFHEDNSDKRKEWIEKWRDVTQCDDIISVDINSIKKTDDKLIQAQDISQFINRELIGYSVASLFRAIPSQYDHLKDSQRKALYSALSYFHFDPKRGKSMKVGRFSNKAADMTQYHHGEKSLIDTFIKMAQDFIGSNNIGFFKKDGQFGTRADGGENAADARYSETHLTWWLPLVYNKESIELIEKRVIDDEECEPFWLPGVIPMGIVNGTNGIATAFSTSTPSHNPLDVIEWYIQKCKGNKPKPILPWYNGFEGKMSIINRDKKNSPALREEFLPGDIDPNRPITSPKRFHDVEEEDLCDMDQENKAILEHCKHSKLTLKTFGKYEIIGVHKNNGPIIKVSELPIKTWIHKYRKWLEYLIHGKHKIKPIYDFKDHSTTEKVDFEIHWNNNYKIPNHATLKLVRSFGISNITLIDHMGFPTRYNNVQAVMETYYGHMKSHYEDIRNNRIKLEEERVVDITFKMKFIIHVLRKDIEIIKVKEEVVKEKMEEFGIPFEYYDKSKGRDFSLESVEKYKIQIGEAKERLEIANGTTAEKIWLDKLNILKKEFSKRFTKGVFNMKK